MRTYSRIRNVLEAKGDEVFTIDMDASAVDCARAMAANDAGSLVVLDGNRVLGIVTWHDLVSALAEHRAPITDAKAKTLMTEVIHTTTPNAQLDDVEALMQRHHIRHLPVMDGNRVVGVVTMLDVLMLHLSHSEAIGQQLVDYVSGYVS